MHTAPTPARTCGTARPTNGTRVVTAAPDCPVAGSIAHSENVEYLREPFVVERHAVSGAELSECGGRENQGSCKAKQDEQVTSVHGASGRAPFYAIDSVSCP